MDTNSMTLADTAPLEPHGTDSKKALPGLGMSPSWFALIERLAPLLLGGIASSLYFVFGRSVSLAPGLRDVFYATVNIAAIGVGFLLTASSILVAVDGKWIVRRAKESGAYKLLVRYLIAATYWCLTVAVVSSVALLFNPAWKLGWYRYGMAAWLFFAGAAFASLWRVLLVFSQMLLGLSDEDE